MSFWRRELESYTGYAELTVVGASGLPPSDNGLLGRSPPDPFFVLKQSHGFLYRSRVFKNNPAPVWNEKVRVFLRPDQDLTFEIHDKGLLRSKVMVRRTLVPLPVDGRFRVADGSIHVELEIVRERSGSGGSCWCYSRCFWAQSPSLCVLTGATFCWPAL